MSPAPLTDVDAPPAGIHAAAPVAAPAPPRARVSARLGAALALGALLVVAALVYRPWEWRPIGIGDVAEYVPLLRSGRSLPERFARLTTFYAREYGRFNPVVFLATAAKWTLFPDDPVAWYWLRFGTMSGVVLLAYAFLRRMGGSRAGAVAGAAVFVCANAAAYGWTVLSIGEPIGLLLVLLALLVATRYRTSADWPLRAAFIAVAVALALLAKEMLVCLLPLVLLVAACHEGGGELRAPRRDRRTTWLVVLCGAVTASVGAGVLYGALQPVRRSFGGAYALANASLGSSLTRLHGALSPATAMDGHERAAVLAAEVALLVVLAAGVRRALRAARADGQRGVLAYLGLALVTPLVGVALYAPWPTWVDLYALPMLVGTAMLVAFAVTALADAPRTVRVASGVLLALAFVVSGSLAWRRARQMTIFFRVNDTLVRTLARVPAADEMTFLVRRPQARLWRTGGALARQYGAGVLGVALPPATELPCDPPPPSPPTGRRVLRVTRVTECGPLAGATIVVSDRYTWFDWSRPGLATDSVRFEARIDDAGSRATDAASPPHPTIPETHP